jgi:hypothetical protein
MLPWYKLAHFLPPFAAVPSIMKRRRLEQVLLLLLLQQTT